MERPSILRKLADWPLLVGMSMGAALITFVVYPPAPGWGSNEKWGDIASWIAAVGAYIAAGVTIWAVLVSIEASRSSIVTAYKLRELDKAEEKTKTDALRSRLCIMFRSELYLLGGMYALHREHLDIARKEGCVEKMRQVLEMGIPNQGLHLIERFASDLYVFPDDVAVHVSYAYSRWRMYVQAPSPDDIAEEDLGPGIYNTLQSLDVAIKAMRLAHKVLSPFMPGFAIISDDENWFSDTDKKYSPI